MGFELHQVVVVCVGLPFGSADVRFVDGCLSGQIFGYVEARCSAVR